MSKPVRLVHQFNTRGLHRIVAEMSDGSRLDGEWAGYEGIARLDLVCGYFVAVTSFHDWPGDSSSVMQLVKTDIDQRETVLREKIGTEKAQWEV